MSSNPSRFKGANSPVENVSWEGVQTFINKLNARERGVMYRLPTEAEWEYAARAGTTTAYSFGESAEQLGEYAWYGDNSGKQTHPVGQKRANGWELYDMHGNVWEWVQDWYGEYPSSPQSNFFGSVNRMLAQMITLQFDPVLGGFECHPSMTDTDTQVDVLAEVS